MECSRHENVCRLCVCVLRRNLTTLRSFIIDNFHVLTSYFSDTFSFSFFRVTRVCFGCVLKLCPIIFYQILRSKLRSWKMYPMKNYYGWTQTHIVKHIFPDALIYFSKPLSQPIIVMTLIKWNEIHSCRKRRKALSQFLNIIHLRKPSHSNSGAGFLITTQKFPVVLIFFLSVKAFLWPRIRSIHFCINPLSIFNHTTSAVICYIT